MLSLLAVSNTNRIHTRYVTLFRILAAKSYRSVSLRLCVSVYLPLVNENIAKMYKV